MMATTKTGRLAPSRQAAHLHAILGHQWGAAVAGADGLAAQGGCTQKMQPRGQQLNRVPVLQAAVPEQGCALPSGRCGLLTGAHCSIRDFAVNLPVERLAVHEGHEADGRVCSRAAGGDPGAFTSPLAKA